MYDPPSVGAVGPGTGAQPEGAILWEPSARQQAAANVTHYLRWLADTKNLRFDSYDALWRWSATEIEAFWASIWEFFQVASHRPYRQVLADRTMPGATWFAGAELNYAEHALRRRDDHVAVIFKAEEGSVGSLTYAQLCEQTGAAALGLRRLGVQHGDRVVGYLPNIPEAVVAFLAAASIGATWSCCSPDFGVASVVDRFKQIEPRVLIAADGYRYNGKPYDRLAAIQEIERQLPGLERTVILPNLDRGPRFGASRTIAWGELVRVPSELSFEPVPFDHPLWVLYSSGTTGLPKPIVHGHGGILLEHLKANALHLDLTADDRFFWFTSTGWMMWNLLVSGLLLGTTVVLYDGSPAYPDLGALWRLAQATQMTYFGASAPYLLSCRKAGMEPGRTFDLHHLKAIGSTGAPLPPEGFQWVYEAVKADLLLGSVSGGTDLCTAFVGSCPLLPVRAGEIQCRGLGARIEAFDPMGRPVVDEVGELVITEPLPSMPLFLWNDRDGSRYRESYFDVFPGVWRHGDWVKVTSRGSCVIYGRSDSTLNRGGVRMGTSEFYRVVDDLPEVQDSLVIDTTQLGVEGQLLLFVVLQPGCALDDDLRARIARALARDLSPRHVPNAIYAIAEVPRTLNGKKLEVPVKRILSGVPAATAVSADAMSNPEALRFFVELAGTVSS